MRCILVFDHLNDILFSKCDKKFIRHIQNLGRMQGFNRNGEDEEDLGELNINYVIQLYSPIVTSQRIMSSQFGNSYTSIQCQDGTNMVFDEYMGYLFVNMGYEDINWLKRMLGICISIVQHLCGPDLSVLKSNPWRRTLVGRMLDTWQGLAGHEQAVLVEAVEQLSVNTELSSAAVAALGHATQALNTQLDIDKSHALVFVDNKFLALYSSRNARELVAGDMLMVSLLGECLRPLQEPLVEEPPGSRVGSMAHLDSSHSSEEYYSPLSSPEPHRNSSATLVEEIAKESMHSEIVLLCGGGGKGKGSTSPAVTPHVVHITTLTHGVSLLILYQSCNDALSTGLNEAFSATNTICGVTTGETESAKRAMEQLESAMKKLFEGIKKLKVREMSPKFEACVKVLHAKWDLLKKQWREQSDGGSSMASVVACSSSLTVCLRELLQVAVFNKNVLLKAAPVSRSIAVQVATTLSHFTDFFKVKALRNFTLGSRSSLSINKYLEEFPGLVHFLYIDRTNHRITAPCLDFKSQQTIALTKKKIWSMVELSRSHLGEGHTAVMWKDTTFNYAFYLWFEDASGAPLKPKVSPSIVVKSLPIPGVISGDFYQKLVEACFPKTAPGKVRCFELYCVHLGLATSSCVLEHSRRLAATICEVTGIPNNPLDLL